MPRPKAKTSRSKTKAPMSDHEMQDKIAHLRRQRVPMACQPEDLDRPLDADIRVDEIPTRSKYRKLAIVIDGQAVSSMNIGDIQQNFGPHRLRVGAIAGVSTQAEHRFRGYSRRAMLNALRWLRQNGFDMTMLFGITGFYPRFGYAPVLPRTEFTMALRDAEAARPAGFRFVRFTPQHLAATLAMYHRNNATRTGPVFRVPAARRPSFRRRMPWGPRTACKVALDRKGRAVGYVVFDLRDPSAKVLEVGFSDPAVFPDILAAAARVAWRNRVENIQFHLPEDDPFIAFCQSMGLAKQVRYLRDGGPMARMINIPSALRKVAPMLAGRMAGEGRISLLTNLDSVQLAWSRGSLRVSAPGSGGCRARLPQWALAQMLYGHQNASTLAVRGVLKASRAALGILDRMFPVQRHFFYPVDTF